MKNILFTLIISATVLPSGCHSNLVDRDYPDLNYSGDGEFQDAGPRAGIERFVLDLGTVDLNRKSVKSYDLVDLPDTQFVCYVRVDHPLPITGRPKDDLDWGETRLKMSLVDGSGNTVFTEEAAVNRWIWSGAVGADRTDLYTRKTDFTPVPGASYRLTLEVNPVDGEAPGGQLLIMGGGWKVNETGAGDRATGERTMPAQAFPDSLFSRPGSPQLPE